MTLDDFLRLFDYSDPAGNGYNVECPAHIDKQASLSVTNGKKGIVLFCQAGCSTDTICAQLGIKTADLFNQPASQNGNGHRKAKDWTVTAVYPYHREDGSWAYEIRRTASKDFLYFRKNDTGEWICGHAAGDYWFSASQNTWFQVKPSSKISASTVRRIYPEGEKLLYRLPELIATPLNQSVIIVEGEKDVNRCYKEGLTATCNPLGAGTNKWLDKFSEHFENRKVIIIPDNDPPDQYDPVTGKTTKGFHGQRHAKRILDSLDFHAALRKTGLEAGVLELQGLPIKGDISDWFDTGHTADELRALIDAAFQAQATSGWQKTSANYPPPPPNNPPNASPNPQPQSAKDYNTTDMGNAERFADKFGDSVRYCSKLGKEGVWLIWDSARWQIDEKLKINQMAKQIVPDIYLDSQNAGIQADKIRLFKWALQTEGLATRNNMIKDARPSLAIAVDELDTHPWLINVINGTIDLRTGKLRPHAQADYLTKMLQIEYDDQAKCEAWMEFINTAQWDKQEMIDYLQKAVGYSLTGDTGEKCMFILHGPKDTGKSTFVETMQMLLGEYAIKIQTQTLMWRREKQQSNDIAILKGARFVHASEAEEHERLAEAQIKEMTGGDTITCRFLHAEFFQFQPEFKLWLSTNHKPKASNDEALWGRLKLIPFTYRITEDQKDRKLKAKLKAELPGILKWAIDGCLKWQAEGLKDPLAVSAATGNYRTQMDTIGHFIDECCELDPDYTEMAGTLYGAYKVWCQDAGERIESKRAFGLKLLDRGLTNKQATSGPDKGKINWHGIQLIPTRSMTGF